MADAREVLERFHAELELVEIIADAIFRKMRGRIERDDLVSAGREGLLAAARRYDPDKGVAFGGFAASRVRGAMLDFVRQTSALKRYDYYRFRLLSTADAVADGDGHRVHLGALSPKAMGAGAVDRSLDEHLSTMAEAAAIDLLFEGSTEGPGRSDDNPEEAVAKADLIAHIRRQLDAMVEERVLNDAERDIIHRHYFQGQSITQIAEELDLGKSWVSDQHTRAMSKLAARIRRSEGS